MNGQSIGAISATATPPQHNLSGVDESLASGLQQLDHIHGRALQVADQLLGSEPAPGENTKCSPVSSGRIGSFEDRLARFHHLIGVLANELARIERAVA